MCIVKRKIILNMLACFSFLGLWILTIALSVFLGFYYAPIVKQNLDSHMITKTIQLKGFSTLNVSRTDAITVRKGSSFSMILKDYQDPTKEIFYDQGKDSLTMSLPVGTNCKFCKRNLMIEIIVPDLKEVNINNGIRLYAQNFSNIDSLDANVSNNSFLSLNGNTNLLNLHVTNNSSIDSSSILVQNVSLTIDSGSYAVLNVQQKLDITTDAPDISNVAIIGNPKVNKHINPHTE